MPARRHPASRHSLGGSGQPTTAGRPGSDAADPQATRRPRSRHVVDRALDYAALADAGERAADIARRRRRSKAHVSILLRLGRALRGCAPEELAALRSPRITWKLAQQLVRSNVADELLLHRLRQALGGFSSLTVDRRRHRKGRPGPGDPLRAPDGTYVWQWDPVWAARDPVGYVEAYRAFLARLHRGMHAAMREHGEAPRPGVALAGQSLRQLSATLGRPGALAASVGGDASDRIATPRASAAREARALLRELDPLLGNGRPAGRNDDDDLA